MTASAAAICGLKSTGAAVVVLKRFLSIVPTVVTTPSAVVDVRSHLSPWKPGLHMHSHVSDWNSPPF